MLQVTDTIAFKIDASNNYYKLYLELKALTESYGGGLAALSHKVSISKPTLWRWANLQNKKAPNPYHVLSLLKFFSKKETSVEIAKYAGGEIEKFLRSSFPADFSRPPEFLREEIDSLLEDFYCYFIYLLCGTEKVMTRDEIKKSVGTYSLDQLGMNIDDDDLDEKLLIRLGQVADLKIDKLISNGVLKETNGELTRLVHNTKIKVATTKKHLPKLFSFFKEKNMHKFSNLMFAYQECIPRETIKIIIDLQHQTFMKCYELMEENKTESGEIYLLTTFFENFGFE